MILQALFKLAKDEHLVPDPDFQMVPVSWLVRVDENGAILGFDDLRQAEETGRTRRRRMVPKPMRVPRQNSARAGTKAPPNFFVDNAKYVFGIATPDKPFSEREGREKADLFRAAIDACVAAASDVGARAVSRALAAVAHGAQHIELPPDCKPNDQFAFVLTSDTDVPVHERPAVVAYWRALRDSTSRDISGQFACILTGATVEEAGSFPKVKQVPGGVKCGVSLVSFNEPAFESHGWDRNENAVLSRSAAEACATALQRLVDPAFPNPDPAAPVRTLPSRRVLLGRSTLVAFWASDRRADPIVDVFGLILDSSDDPAVVGAAFDSWRRGWPQQLDRTWRFYAIVLSGAQGRLVIRDWIDTSIDRVVANVTQYTDDLRVVRNTPPPAERALPPIPPLDTLLASLAPFGDRAAIPAPLASAFVDAVIQATPFPLSILQRALERTRAEIGKTAWSDLDRRDARAALIKAVLVRRRRLMPAFATYPEPTKAMDPSNDNPGYLLGRLMAVLERLQQVALGSPNASVVDRYFSAASASPRGVFVRLLKNARHHARKAEDDDRTAGLAHWLERQMDDIADRFSPRMNGFPATLSLEDQGLFVLGYHQERHWLSLSKAEREQTIRVDDVAAPAA